MSFNILLNKNTSVFSSNVESNLNIDLSTKNRLLKGENVVKYFSLYDQYNKERDNCDKFRLIFTINPLCSNILYNAKTEIIVNEGSSATTVICDCKGGGQFKYNQYSGSGENRRIVHIGVAPSATSSISVISYMDAIRNTEYSHPLLGNFSYQCGYNIFNNHMLRSNNYIHVNKSDKEQNNSNIGNYEEEELKYYNTLADYSRNSLGQIIEQDVSVSYKYSGNTKMHLHYKGSVMSLKQAFRERIEERDGWWGFINPSFINIPNRENKDILTNTLIASKKPCDFIDLYPDRSLYSFIPKYNQYRNRLERNWDYCLTYPYANDYEMINTVCGANNFSIKVNFIKKFNSAGNDILECSSYFNHNLKPGSQISIYYYSDIVDEIQKYNEITVENVGDVNGENKDKIFTIKCQDILSIYDLLVGFNKNTFFFKRLNGNVECEYYFRKFRKIKNSEGNDLKSDVNKIAFAENIYGDDVAQIIFYDDIDTSNLIDNNGRPVSEIYLTIIKRNAGHKLWYQEENLADYIDTNKYNDEYGIIDLPKSASSIEYSHCFGKVTSGLDFSGMKEEPFNYNIHRMHNLTMETSAITQWFREYDRLDFGDSGETIYCKMKNDDGTFPTNESWNDNNSGTTCDRKIISAMTLSDRFRTFTMWGDAVFDKPLTLEDDITIDNEDFYGDVVEFDIVECKETIISKVYHRFNTAQRETFDKCFRDILEDRIVSDDYDFYVQDFTADPNVPDSAVDSGFTMKTYYLNNALQAGLEVSDEPITNVVNEIEGRKGLIYGNIMPEGSYYNPHVKVLLKSESESVSNAYTKLINYRDGDVSANGNMITVIYPSDLGFFVNDIVALYDKVANKIYWCTIININHDTNSMDIQLNNEFINDKMEMVNESDGIIDENYFIGVNRINIYWSQNVIPSYAKLNITTNQFSWRELTPPSKLLMYNELYDTTFSNGRFYIEKNVNFFLRRQDPFGKYGLSTGQFIKIGKGVSNPLDNFIINGHEPDFSSVITTLNNYDNCY